MSISSGIKEAMTRGSFIRAMFEDGLRMKKEFGEDNVFDFSLGNPDVPPPTAFRKALLEEAGREGPGLHGYMPNAGSAACRQALSDWYSKTLGLPFQPADIIMTSGAGGAMNVVLKSLLEPGDEVVVLAPFFVEYNFYVTNHGGRVVICQTDDRFLPDFERLGEALGPRTRAVIINSPNNPTGVVYDSATAARLGELLGQASRRHGRTIYLISDEPYRGIIYDGATYPSPFLHYADTIVVTSNSKDLSLAGERIGHVAIGPRAQERAALSAACTFCNRILGFVNANALMQRVLARIQGAMVDVKVYERRRDTLCAALAGMGFKFVKPGGAFYLFPESPLPDDVQFARFMRDRRVIVVPGSGFSRPGHFRISYAVKDSVIERSLDVFAGAARELGL